MGDRGKREIGVLLVGGALTALLRFLGLAVLARLVGPGPLGEFALFMATVTVLSSVGTLGLDSAILLGSENEGASAWWASFLVSIPLAGVAALAIAWSPSGGGLPAASATVAALCVGSGAAVSATTKLLLRQHLTTWIAGLQVAIVAAQLLAQITLLSLGFRPISALVLGVGVSALLVGVLHAAIGLAKGVTIRSVRGAWAVALRNRNLAVFTVPVLLVRRFRDQALLSLVTGWCGATSAGFYQAAQRLTTGLAGIAVSPLGAVSQRAMSRNLDQPAWIESMLARRMAEAIRWSVAIATPVAAFPGLVTQLALGPAWRGAAPLIPWFAWSAVAYFAFSWGDRGLTVARKQHGTLIAEAATTVAAVGLAYAVVSSRDCTLVVAVCSVVLSVGYAILAVMGVTAVGADPIRIARLLTPEGFFWLAGIGVAGALALTTGDDPITAGILATATLATAWGLTRRAHPTA